MDKKVTIKLDLSHQEAWDYAQFLKRVGHSDYLNNAQDSDEAYRMLRVGEQIQAALAAAGIAPR